MTDFHKKYNDLLHSTNAKGEQFKTDLHDLQLQAKTEKEKLWEIFFSARLDIFNNKYKQAQNKLDKILNKTPDNSLNNSILLSVTFLNKAITLERQNKLDEAIIICDEIDHRYKDINEPDFIIEVAKALRLKANTLDRQNKPDAKIKIYNEVDRRYKDINKPDLMTEVAIALRSKADTLDQQNKPDEVITVCDEIDRRYKDSNEPDLMVEVAIALILKAVTLGQQNKPDEEIKLYDEIDTRYKDSNEPSLMVEVAIALRCKADTLGQQNKPDEEIKLYDEIDTRYKDSDEPGLMTEVAIALNSKADMLSEQNKLDEVITVCDEIVRRYKDSDEPGLMTEVAIALNSKADMLNEQNKLDEIITVCDEIVRRYKDSDEPGLMTEVAITLNYKGYTLSKQNKLDEAITVYNEIINRYKNKKNASLLEQVFFATIEKGICFLISSKANLNDIYNNIEKYAEKYKELYLIENNEEYIHAWPDDTPLYQWIALKKESLSANKIENKTLFSKCIFSLCYLADILSDIKPDELNNKVNDSNKEVTTYYHYTKMPALRSIIPEKPVEEPVNLFRISNMEYVNDPEEGMALVNHCRKCEKQCEHGQLFDSFFDKTIDPAIAGKMYVLCFTENGDRLDHWRLYANDGDGLSVGIPKNAFRQGEAPLIREDIINISPRTGSKDGLDEKQIKVEKKQLPSKNYNNNYIELTTPKRVMYDPKSMDNACKKIQPALSIAYNNLQKLEQLKEKDPANRENYDAFISEYRSGVQGLLLDVLYLFKSKEYENEKEHRILVFAPDFQKAHIDQTSVQSGKPPIIYLKSEPILFKNKGYEIYIGPKVNQPRLVQLELDYRLSKNNFRQNVTIHVSKLPYR